MYYSITCLVTVTPNKTRPEVDPSSSRGITRMQSLVPSKQMNVNLDISSHTYYTHLANTNLIAVNHLPNLPVSHVAQLCVELG